jgi:uncharacterized protein (DUF2249 family)
MTEATIIDFDVRELSPQERYTAILARFDTLGIGQTLRLIFDQQPRLLPYQLLLERPGMYELESERQGPETWVIRLRKTASEIIQDGPFI